MRHAIYFEFLSSDPAQRYGYLFIPGTDKGPTMLATGSWVRHGVPVWTTMAFEGPTARDLGLPSLDGAILYLRDAIKRGDWDLVIVESVPFSDPKELLDNIGGGPSRSLWDFIQSLHEEKTHK